MEDRSELLFAAVRNFSFFKKSVYTGIAALPIMLAAFGVYESSQTCAHAQNYKLYVGCMAAGIIFSLFSFVWIIILLPGISKKHSMLMKHSRFSYLIIVFICIMFLKAVLSPLGASLERRQLARCRPSINVDAQSVQPKRLISFNQVPLSARRDRVSEVAPP